VLLKCIKLRQILIEKRTKYLIECDQRLEKMHVAKNAKRSPPVVVDLFTTVGIANAVRFDALHHTDGLHDQTNSGRWRLHRPHYCDVLSTKVTCNRWKHCERHTENDM